MVRNGMREENGSVGTGKRRQRACSVQDTKELLGEGWEAHGRPSIPCHDENTDTFHEPRPSYWIPNR